MFILIMAAIHTRTCISTVHISSGSPFNCKVGGTTGINEESMLTTQQRATDVTHVGSTCELSLKIPGMHNHSADSVSRYRVIFYTAYDVAI